MKYLVEGTYTTPTATGKNRFRFELEANGEIAALVEAKQRLDKRFYSWTYAAPPTVTEMETATPRKAAAPTYQQASLF